MKVDSYHACMVFVEKDVSYETGWQVYFFETGMALSAIV